MELFDSRVQGELCLKSDVIMKGYLNNDAETNEIVDKQGWLHTGKFYTNYLLCHQNVTCRQEIFA